MVLAGTSAAFDMHNRALRWASAWPRILAGWRPRWPRTHPEPTRCSIARSGMVAGTMRRLDPLHRSPEERKTLRAVRPGSLSTPEAPTRPFMTAGNWAVCASRTGGVPAIWC